MKNKEVYQMKNQEVYQMKNQEVYQVKNLDHLVNQIQNQDHLVDQELVQIKQENHLKEIVLLPLIALLPQDKILIL